MCFLLLFIAFQVRIVHQRPLCFRRLTTKLLTQKKSLRLPAQQNTQTQSDPAKLFLLISSAVQRATHVPVLQCLTVIVMNSLQPCIPTQQFVHQMLIFCGFRSLLSESQVRNSLLIFDGHTPVKYFGGVGPAKIFDGNISVKYLGGG